jgi:hypothetical protein
MSNVKKLIVENLRNDLDIMSTPHKTTGKTNLWDVAVSINRTNPVPLDKSSIIFEDAVTKTEGDTTITIPGTTIENAAEKATAYPGQVISGLKSTDGKVYVLQPDDHEHSTHIANAGESKTYSDQTKSEESVYEELATQSNVDYQVNKEAYQRQVVNNARTNTEKQIAKFILEKDKSESIDANGDIVDLVNIDKNGDIILTVPGQLSDSTTTPSDVTTVLDYVKATVNAEKEARKATTEDLAYYIGTDCDIDNKGNLSKLGLPDLLSDKTSTPSDTVKNLLQYIEATVEAEVQKRYQQDQVLLKCINELSLTEVIPETVAQTTTTIDAQDKVNSALTYTDGTLLVDRTKPFRSKDSDVQDKSTINTNSEELPKPLQKYNSGYPTT